MIDLRSDTVTRPTPAMRAAMAAAEVGDDVHGEDPTANELQDTVAALLGKEAALFVTSGTQGNLCGLLAHCGRGDEYIVGGHAHTYMYEGGGAAVLGSIQPQPVPTGDDGMIDLAAAEAAVKSPDHHFARTRLLCLENTTDGRVLTLGQMEASAALAARHGLAHHLDGARLWNASVALGVSPAAVAEPFDSVSVCLSKGLGTPMGSVLVGPADLIDEAHKWRKMLGGGLRQAGIVAAAGLYALEHHIDRLADDHANAARLADGLAAIDGVKIDWCATNMVFIRVDEGLGDSSDLQDGLEGRGILTRWSGSQSRLVTHLDVTAEDIETAIDAFAELLA
ncbi:MAG: low-specificity L-threonine aldolase [Acidimicrobiaceae bacterium]|nr:low-specificity L-threonine aldolase [Acidimicrobiaceae bacterium]MDE0493487.1 low-specificity L-threonine aldolase [Acidimicrobiaceae bacterium]